MMGEIADWVNDDTPEPNPVERLNMRNRNIEIMTSSGSMAWETPQEFVDVLPFDLDLDVCATNDNHKCMNWITPERNAFLFTWGARGCFMNPPFGRHIGDWIEKAYQESKKGSLVVCLVPNRTETNWFSRIWSDASLICFVGRRIKFLHPDRNKEKNGAPFANVIAVFGKLPEKPDYSLGAYHALRLSKIGTVIVPGAGNIWLHEGST